MLFTEPLFVKLKITQSQISIGVMKIKDGTVPIFK
jgi:hypothetical protein